MIPDSLGGWTLQVVHGLVEQGVFETDLFDFKEMLPHTRDEDGKRRLRRDTAAFANSAGGFLIFGVKNDKGLSANDRIVGLPMDHDFPEQFGNYASASEPSVEWSFKNPPIGLPSERVLHVVHVPSSPRRPHGLFEDQRWWFCKRTNKGTEVMGYTELRNAFSSTHEKLAKLKMLIAEIALVRERAHNANVLAAHAGWGGWRGDVPRYDHSLIAALTLDVANLLADDEQALKDLANLRHVLLGAEDIRAAVGPVNRMNARIAAANFQRAALGIIYTIDRLLPALRKAATRG